MKYYRYYSTQRPITPGTVPKDSLIGVVNYGARSYVPEIDREAWGHADYSRMLTGKEINEYELHTAGKFLSEEFKQQIMQRFERVN